MSPFRPRPDAATWLPLVALGVLLALAVFVARRVPATPAGRLHGAAEDVARALAAGDVADVWSRLAPEARGFQAAVGWERLARTVEGAKWRVLAVDPSRARTTVVFLGLRQPTPFGLGQGAGEAGALAVDFVWQPDTTAPRGWQLVAARDAERPEAG